MTRDDTNNEGEHPSTGEQSVFYPVTLHSSLSRGLESVCFVLDESQTITVVKGNYNNRWHISER